MLLLCFENSSFSVVMAVGRGHLGNPATLQGKY